jgi:hypothetical protein
MHAHETAVIVAEHERAAKHVGYGALLAGGAALVFAAAVLLYVLWLLLAGTTATGFDADGVSCYHRAVQLACLKTANP